MKNVMVIFYKRILFSTLYYCVMKIRERLDGMIGIGGCMRWNGRLVLICLWKI